VLVRKEPMVRDSERGLTGGDGGERLKLGTIVHLVAQHACLTAANHPWYYIIDSDIEGGDEKVVDIWIPWKGW
jgi:D-serine ammonia-lyase